MGFPRLGTEARARIRLEDGTDNPTSGTHSVQIIFDPRCYPQQSTGALAAGSHRPRAWTMSGGTCERRSVACAGALLLVAWLAPIMSAQALPGLGAARVDVQPNLVLVAYAAAVMLFTALVCGITPALRSTRGQITSDLQHGGSRTSTGHLRLRHTFVVAQVAISLFLLVVASLSCEACCASRRSIRASTSLMALSYACPRRPWRQDSRW